MASISALSKAILDYRFFLRGLILSKLLFIASIKHIQKLIKRTQQCPLLHEKRVLLCRLLTNRPFCRQFFILIRLCIPRIYSMEFGGLLAVCTLLILRTKVTVATARALGRAGKLLVHKNQRSFSHALFDLVLWMIPATILSVGVDYSTAMMEVRFRDNMQKALNQKYLSDSSGHPITFKCGLDDLDHRITEDVRVFCRSFMDIFQSGLKPFLDVVAFSVEFSKSGVIEAPAFVLSYFLVVATLRSCIFPNFSKLLALSQEKEGQFRVNEHQIIQHSEEIAFYGSERRERERADELLESILLHERHIKDIKWSMGIMDSVLVKDGATCVGYLVCGGLCVYKWCALPHSQIAELYLASSELYMPLSRAVGKLLMLHKKVAALRGSTHRVGELLESLSRISFEVTLL